MTMITPSYLGETIEYSSLHACRSTLEDPTAQLADKLKATYTKIYWHILDGMFTVKRTKVPGAISSQMKHPR